MHSRVESGGTRVDSGGTRIDSCFQSWLWGHQESTLVPPESILVHQSRLWRHQSRIRFKISTINHQTCIFKSLILCASRNPTSASSASSFVQMPQDSANFALNGTNIAPTTYKIEPRWRPGAPKWSPNGAKMGSKRRKKNAIASRNGVEFHSPPPFWSKK